MKLTLNVPNDHVWLTEYSDWADFLFNLKYTKPHDYTRVDPLCMEEFPQRKLNKLILETTEDLKANERGGIGTDSTAATNRPGIFAGGDAVTGAATVIKAMGAGKTAAAGIDEYLSK